MGENIGQYTVGLTVDYSQFISSIADAEKKLEQSAQRMAIVLDSLGVRTGQSMQAAVNSIQKGSQQTTAA